MTYRTRLAPALAAALFATVLAPSLAHAARSVTITGGGWGHGIGMSQYGAYGRAKKGRSAQEIVEHYYRGASLASRRMPKVRVGLLQDRQSVSMTSVPHQGGSGNVVWKVKGESEALATGGPGVQWRVEPSAAGGLRLYKDGTQVRRNGTGVFGGTSAALLLNYAPHGSAVDVADKSYNYALGRLEVGSYSSARCDTGFCLRLVLSISMQKYLMGLAEVPSSWPAAVLRTQAIAGRTYAYEKWTRSGSHRVPCDCTVYDSVIDQAYAGDGKRTGSGEYWDEWQAAVRDTKGQVIVYGGNPIQALYSSSSGGHTENNEHVWGGTPLPYLRGVKDAADAVSANPNHRWSPVEMSFRDFATKVESRYPAVGDFQDLKVVLRGVSGRVSALNGGGLRLIGSKSTVQTSGWDFRTKFGSDVLKDTLFYVDISTDVGTRFETAYRRLDGAPGEATSSPYAVPKQDATKLGQAQDFTKGRMTWRKETDKVVWQWGQVLERYDAIGREGSVLGMPSSSVWGKDGGYKGASYVSGAIFWSKSTGAHHIRHPFFTEFRAVGGRERLGLPTTDVKRVAGADRQRFRRGTIYLPPRSEVAYALWGKIDEKYRSIGAGTSKCGHPTSSMVVDGAGSAATFQNGSIVATRTGGVQVHCG
ncbi:MAG TPA: SpoIID/LytB domain-containing protein [Actinomycetota bacterium]|nr:SpoIID/LytB domain-containing protein [Actinomycetota bacterium]